MASSVTATPSINISYTLTNVDGSSTTTETATAGYATDQYTNGTGTGNVNMGVVITGYISSGETVAFDFKQLSKNVWGNEIPLNFTSSGSPLVHDERGVKGMILTNTWTPVVLPTGASNISSWSSVVTGISGNPSSFVTGIDTDFLPRLTLNATGDISEISGGFTDILSSDVARTGRIYLNPKSTWSFSDTIGKTPIYDDDAELYRHVITLTTDNFSTISGSGGLSSGTSGDAVFYPIWNDFAHHVNDKGELAINPWSGNLARLTYELGIVGVVAPNEGCVTYTVCYT